MLSIEEFLFGVIFFPLLLRFPLVLWFMKRVSIGTVFYKHGHKHILRPNIHVMPDTTGVRSEMRSSETKCKNYRKWTLWLQTIHFNQAVISFYLKINSCNLKIHLRNILRVFTTEKENKVLSLPFYFPSCKFNVILFPPKKCLFSPCPDQTL